MFPLPLGAWDGLRYFIVAPRAFHIIILEILKIRYKYSTVHPACNVEHLSIFWIRYRVAIPFKSWTKIDKMCMGRLGLFASIYMSPFMTVGKFKALYQAYTQI